MVFHGITVFPAPYGSAKCGHCYLQMYDRWTSSCTLCVMYQEANLAEASRYQQQGFTQIPQQAQQMNPPVAVAVQAYKREY